MAKGTAKLGFFSRKSTVANIDRRLAPAKLLQRVIDGLVDELGGEGAVTFRQRLMIEVCADLAMRLQLAMGQTANGDDARESDRHVVLMGNSLRKHLAALDIATLPDPGPSLAEYLSARQAERVA